MWTWAFSYQAIRILSTVYRKHHGNTEYCSNCFQMHGNHAISQGEHPNWKSVINNTTFKIKIMKSIFQVLWDILLSELRTRTIYYPSEPQTLTNMQELWSLISQHTDASIRAAKIICLHLWWALSPDEIPTRGLIRGREKSDIKFKVFWLLMQS